MVTVSPEESVNRVMKLMTHHRVRHMPVLRDGKLAGIISIGDVVKYRLAVCGKTRQRQGRMIHFPM